MVLVVHCYQALLACFPEGQGFDEVEQHDCEAFAENWEPGQVGGIAVVVEVVLEGTVAVGTACQLAFDIVVASRLQAFADGRAVSVTEPSF